MNIIIAGIHTGIGKTVCSTVICQALGYDYFKPIQAGDLDCTDSMFVSQHITNTKCTIHRESYRLQTPASPHYAAALEGILINKEAIQLPSTTNNLLVETAGGIMSPLAEGLLNIDLMAHLNLPTVLVSNNYLGSINHTLMTYELLKARGIPLLGLVFNGLPNEASESYILNYTQLPLLFSIPQWRQIDKNTISNFASSISISF